ncbi:WxL protein peptidoglycan domain-containing protein [Saccharothrix stipae]
MTRTWRRSALSGLLALVFSGLVAPAVSAAPATFGVRPATAQAPDTRSAFTYSATPGAVVRDHVAVSNVGNDPVTLRVYASDAFNTPEGGFDLLPAGREPVDVGKWSVVERGEVAVAPRSTVIVPFTLTVPADATPGDHTGGIVASLTTEATGADGQRVAVEQRVGARVYLRVSGDLRPSLSIEDLTADYSGSFFGRGDTTVGYVVRNTGNVRLGGEQEVRVETPWGTGVDAPGLADLPELLPGNTFRVTTTVPGVLPAGWLDALVHVEPVAPQGTEALAVVTADVTTAAVPWLLVVVLLLVLAYVVFRRVRRGRRRVSPEPLPEVEHVAA